MPGRGRAPAARAILLAMDCDTLIDAGLVAEHDGGSVTTFEAV